MLSENEKIKHLYNRATFGVPITGLPFSNSYQEVLNHILEKKNLKTLTVISQEEVNEIKEKAKSEGKKSQVDARKMLKKNIADLSNMWFQEIIKSDAQLQEKMAVFWHGHFACRAANPYFDQQYLDIIRKNALGNFKTLLFEVSKTPSMLQFLNNQQNKKDHPNENFAREVMELFTLGRGNYTEEDIKESARAFTGYSYDKIGEFKFRKSIHDFGSKTFLGKTGNFTGDDILNIILEKRECAYFITKKIYRFFVNDENIDESIIKNLGDEFYQSGYDIKTLMHSIFSSDWFYDEKNVGNKIKSPVELLASMFRIIPTTFENSIGLLYIQRVLGQVLLNPPNVAGWKGGRNWIDSSSLLFRMRLPQIIFYDADLDITPKNEIPEMNSYDFNALKMQDAFIKKLAQKKLAANSNWTNVLKQFSYCPDVWNDVSNKLLSSRVDANTAKIVKTNADTSTKENEIKSVVINMMSLPEFQLC
ncbi:MAG: DUF1800 domain-containing protein [Chitinophagales bacterium]|nr:DUF1800 domain-containing protein [Bacteroidota bacterium]